MSEAFLIIRNQQDFEEQVTGNCQTSIDFAQYDLVIGTKQLSRGLEAIEYDLVEDCETGDRKLIVTFKRNEATVAPVVIYQTLIPKGGVGQKLRIKAVLE